MKPRSLSFVLALIAGALFGAGLLISGMTQPAKVIGFLDVRAWDPTLMFVMGGAVVVYHLLFRLIRQRPKPVLGGELQLPRRIDIDRRLVIGSALFGVGWGLAGWCPGPAIVSAAGSATALAFLAAMLAGMYLHWRLKP